MAVRYSGYGQPPGGVTERRGGAEAALPVVTKVLRTLKHTEDATPVPTTPQLHALCDIALALAAALAAKHAPGALPPGRVPGDVPLPTAFYQQRPKADLGAPQRRPPAPGGPGQPRGGVTLAVCDPAPFGTHNQRGRGARARAGRAVPACGVRRAVWPPAQARPAHRSRMVFSGEAGCARRSAAARRQPPARWPAGGAGGAVAGPWLAAAARRARPARRPQQAAQPADQAACRRGGVRWPWASVRGRHRAVPPPGPRALAFRPAALAPALPLGEHLTVTVPLRAGRATAMQAARARRCERSRAGSEEVTDLVYNLCNVFRASLWGRIQRRG